MRRAILVAAVVAAMATTVRAEASTPRTGPATAASQNPAPLTPIQLATASEPPDQAKSPANINAPPRRVFLVLTLLVVGLTAVFVAAWFLVLSAVVAMSGWPGLAARYPDRPEPALAKLDFQSAMMGMGVRISGVLTLTACPSGLRVAIWRLFGPFSRPFFVPWREMAAEPLTLFFSPMTRLRLGDPQVGVLTVHARVWERLQNAARREAPTEIPPAHPVPEIHVVRGAFAQWILATILASALFYFGPRVVAPSAAHPPLLLCVGFPAFFLGIAQLLVYLGQRRRP